MTRLGLSIASHSGLRAAQIGAHAAAAERAGFAAVFVAEGHGDALSLCHPVVAATERVTVGTAVANAALRSPVLAAKAAVALDAASGGRFVLGLGVANTIMNARFGLPAMPPLRMMEEYVGVVRAVLSGRTFSGELYQSGQIPLDHPPHRAGLPIHLAALSPRMLELAGRIADGVILNLMSPDQTGEAAARVRAAADGRPVEITCVVHCCLADDPGLAAEAARAVVPRYVLHPSVARLFAGHATALQAVAELVLAGDRTAAAGKVPQEVADAFVASGSAESIRARVEEYRAVGVDLPVLFPMPVAGDWGYERVIAI
ncbi:LLM class flavin-dependent oxidoreductase [Nonomuraea sp. NPDC050556]|uniref:LLM class flavin-dependent oxidoreductase n=1 Tax=Nonomuraea sp. NPDC050556 TaxID=3364369 RepID=UPI0037BE01CA